jgi:polyphosphate kinase
MCALRPGVAGLSENIRVRSVLGRYLEHSRIFAFENLGEREYFIGSADMMHRNLDRRVETLVRIVQPDHKEILQEILDLGMSDDTASWALESSGSWLRRRDSGGEALVDLQDELMRRTLQRKRLRG